MDTHVKEINADIITKFLYPDLGSEEIKSLEEEVFKDFDPLEALRAHKDELEELERSSELLEDMKAEYDPAKHDREYVEPYYLLKMDILFHLARRFHPLSDYGKEMLAKAVECRKEFEKKHGTLTSSITKENAELFSEVLSADIIDEIKCQKCRGIGALRTDKDRTIAAGAIAWYIDTDPLENEPVLRLKWLYVDEGCRYTGVAGSLIGEMVYLMAQNDSISAMTLDYPINTDEGELLGELLQEWHFSFMTGLNPDFICSLSDIRDIEKLDRYSEWTKNASNLRDKELMVILRENFSGDNAYRYLLRELPEGYLDKEICCYTGDMRKPDGMLLAHCCPSGKVRVEYLYCKPDAENRILFLISCFLLNAVKKYPKDTEVVIPVEAIEVGEVLDKLIPDHKTDLMVEGILSPPSEEENITGEQLKNIMEIIENSDEQL